MVYKVSGRNSGIPARDYVSENRGTALQSTERKINKCEIFERAKIKTDICSKRRVKTYFKNLVVSGLHSVRNTIRNTNSITYKFINKDCTEIIGQNGIM